MDIVVTADQLKKIAGPAAKTAIVNGVASFINELGDQYHLDTPQRIALFVAHTAVESAYYSTTIENLNYSIKGLMKTWPNRFPTKESAEPYANNPRALANKTYGGRMGNNRNDDGWKHRGFGIKQLTGKENQTNFYKWVKKLYPDVPDLTKNPEIIAQMPWAVLSAIYFWEEKEIWRFADGKTVDVDGSTVKINGGKNGIADRKIMFNAAAKVFITPDQPTLAKTASKPKKRDLVLLDYQTKLNRIAEYKKEPSFNVGKADGWFGEKTEKAIKAFEKDAGVEVNGILDPETKEAIDNVIVVIDTGKTTSIKEDLVAVTEPTPVVVEEVPVSIPARLLATIDKPIYKDKSILSYFFGGSGFLALVYNKGEALFLGLAPMVQVAIILALLTCVILGFQAIRESLRAKKGMKELKVNVAEAKAEIAQKEEEVVVA